MIYYLYLRQTISNDFHFFIEAPSPDDIRKVPPAELLKLLNPDPEDHNTCTPGPENIELRTLYQHGALRKVGGEQLYGYMVDGKLLTTRAEYTKAKKQSKNSPLPGQMGIPGIVDDVPKK